MRLDLGLTAPGARRAYPEPNVPRFRPRGGHRKRPARRVTIAAFIAIAAVLACLIEGVRLLGAGQDLMTGRDELLAGLKSLEAGGPALTQTEASAASTHFHTADKRLTSAQSVLAHDPLVIVTGFIPYIGSQARAVQNLSDIGLHASRSGLIATRMVDALLAETAIGPGSSTRSPGERLLLLLREFDRNRDAIDNELHRVRVDRSRIPSAGLSPQLGTAVEQLDSKLGRVTRAVSTLRAIEPGLHSLLGSDGGRSYLVLQQDPAELRGSGGFIGSVGFLEFDHGKMAPYQPRDIYEIDNNAAGTGLGKLGNPRYVPPPAPLDRFIHPFSWELRDANWSPDFPTAARQAEFLLHRQTGREVSGVIAIDPFLVSAILSVVGPTTVPETGDIVNSDNFFAKTLERVELHQGPGARKSFLSFAAKAILDRLFQLPSPQWSPLLETLQRACEAHSLQAYFEDRATQAMVDRFRCGGQVHPLKSDGVLVVDSNVNGNKDDFFVRRSYGLRVEVGPAGTVRHVLHLHYDSLAPHQGLTGEYIDWLRVYVPRTSKIVAVEGATLHASNDLDRLVIEGWLGFRYFSSADVTITYDVTTPIVDSRQPSLELFWQKQAGRAADPIKVDVRLPSGWKIQSASVNTLNYRGNSISTDLAVDRDFVFRFSPP